MCRDKLVRNAPDTHSSHPGALATPKLPVRTPCVVVGGLNLIAAGKKGHPNGLWPHLSPDGEPGEGEAETCGNIVPAADVARTNLSHELHEAVAALDGPHPSSRRMGGLLRRGLGHGRAGRHGKFPAATARCFSRRRRRGPAGAAVHRAGHARANPKVIRGIVSHHRAHVERPHHGVLSCSPTSERDLPPLPLHGKFGRSPGDGEDALLRGVSDVHVRWERCNNETQQQQHQHQQ